MELKSAISALSALAQETRLSAFRVLVNQGPEGLPAGEIAQRLNVPPATLSFHLRELENAGLLRSCRQSRQIYYSADFAGMRSLLDFLMADCCGGHPEICDPVRSRPRAGVNEGA
jgi:DNA-binding transcriptional ArsR family regulator